MFGVYVFTEGELNARRTFVSLSLLNVISIPFLVFPRLISGIIQVWIFFVWYLEMEKASALVQDFSLLTIPNEILCEILTRNEWQILRKFCGYKNSAAMKFFNPNCVMYLFVNVNFFSGALKSTRLIFILTLFFRSHVFLIGVSCYVWSVCFRRGWFRCD